MHALEVRGFNGRATAPFDPPRGLAHVPADALLEGERHPVELALGEQGHLLLGLDLHAALEVLQRLAPVVLGAIAPARRRLVHIRILVVGGGLVPRGDDLVGGGRRSALALALALSRGFGLSLGRSLRGGPLRERPLAQVRPRVGRERLLVPVDRLEHPFLRPRVPPGSLRGELGGVARAVPLLVEHPALAHARGCGGDGLLLVHVEVEPEHDGVEVAAGDGLHAEDALAAAALALGPVEEELEGFLGSGQDPVGHVVHADGVVGLVPPVLVERGHVKAAHLARVRLDAHAVQRGGGGNHGAVGGGDIDPGLLQHEQHVLAGEASVEHVHDDDVAPLDGHAQLSALQLGAVAVGHRDLPGHLVERHVAAGAVGELGVPLARDDLFRSGSRGHHGEQPGPGAYVEHPGAPIGTRDGAIHLPRDRRVVRPRAFLVAEEAKVKLGKRGDPPVQVEVLGLLDPELHAHGVVDARHRL